MSATPKQLLVIHTTYATIPDLEHGWSDYRQGLLNLCLEGERRHREGHPAPAGFSRMSAARYFAVKRLWEAVQRTKPVRISEVLRVRSDYAYALALADDDTFGPLLKAWVDGVDWTEFDKLDYVELMK